MNSVKPKKHLGQHFLKDKNIARKIVESLTFHKQYQDVLEIGPGTGVLTEFLIEKQPEHLYLIDIDRESIDFLNERFPELKPRTLGKDFLRADLSPYLKGKYGIIGNFPYNISSQIFFRVLDHKDKVEEVVCMLQREVAQRIASGPGNKDYGILSVLLQAFYTIEYLFTVDEGVFQPPPKVKSGVIRLKRNDIRALECDEKLFFKLVKQGFQQRRKTLRNALKGINLPVEMNTHPLLDKRAEQLSVQDFETLGKEVERLSK
jgi:16S rRNA (adenine1518-N6/adenine1519-N6)-dimethyltransferase